jgi:hypothetical protein
MNPIVRMMKRYIKMPLKYALPLLFIGALVLASTTGCIQTSVTPSNNNGSWLNPKDVSSGLVISAKAVSPSPQDMGGVKPKSGNVYVVYDCTVKNVGAEGVTITAYYWHLKSATGYYDAKDKIPVVAPEFSNIQKSHVGDVGSGYVYFEVPSNSSNGPWTSLRYTNLGLSSIGANQTFDLSVNV